MRVAAGRLETGGAEVGGAEVGTANVEVDVDVGSAGVVLGRGVEVTCVGLAKDVAPFEQAPEEEWRRVVDVWWSSETQSTLHALVERMGKKAT